MQNLNLKKLKKCSKCGELKSKTEFHKYLSSKDGLQSYCKSCKKVSNVKFNTGEYRAKYNAKRHDSYYNVYSYWLNGKCLYVGQTEWQVKYRISDGYKSNAPELDELLRAHKHNNTLVYHDRIGIPTAEDIASMEADKLYVVILRRFDVTKTFATKNMTDKYLNCVERKVDKYENFCISYYKLDKNGFNTQLKAEYKTKNFKYQFPVEYLN